MEWVSYISRAPGKEDDDFPTLLDIQAAFGFIPNFYRAQTIRPDLIDAEAGLVGALLQKECALTRRQKEYIFLACSADNLSSYCVTAHCEIVRMLRIEGPEPEQIALDHTAADLTPADRTLLDFAVKLNNHQKDVGLLALTHFCACAMCEISPRQSRAMYFPVQLSKRVRF